MGFESAFSDVYVSGYSYCPCQECHARRVRVDLRPAKGWSEHSAVALAQGWLDSSATDRKTGSIDHFQRHFYFWSLGKATSDYAARRS
jgi:hypothetical protein